MPLQNKMRDHLLGGSADSSATQATNTPDASATTPSQESSFSQTTNNSSRASRSRGRSLRKHAVPLMGLLLFLTLSGGALYVGLDNFDQSQDIRQQASVQDGVVIADVNSRPAPRIGERGSMQIRINTKGLQTDGVQLFVSFPTQGMRDIQVNPAIDSLNEIFLRENTAGGTYEIGYAGLAGPESTGFSTNQPTTVLNISYTATANAAIPVSFDVSRSKVTDRSTQKDELRTPDSFEIATVDARGGGGGDDGGDNPPPTPPTVPPGPPTPSPTLPPDDGENPPQPNPTAVPTSRPSPRPSTPPADGGGPNPVSPIPVPSVPPAPTNVPGPTVAPTQTPDSLPYFPSSPTPSPTSRPVNIGNPVPTAQPGFPVEDPRASGGFFERIVQTVRGIFGR